MALRPMWRRVANSGNPVGEAIVWWNAVGSQAVKTSRSISSPMSVVQPE